MSTAEAPGKFGQPSASMPASPVAESPNRQLQGRVVFDAARVVFREPAYRAVEDVCKSALIQWRNAKAAILFGSRTRGDHRADSDWDVAFVTDEEESLLRGVLVDLKELKAREGITVQALAISHARLHEGADSLGDIAAPIAREGRLIAGYWECPETGGKPILKPHSYKEWRIGALRHIASAANDLAEAIGYAQRDHVRNELRGFVANSSDAAEIYAKIAFGRLTSGKGADVPRRHQVNETADRVDRVLGKDVGPVAAWWRSERGRRCRELLEKMNGYGKTDHQSGYPESKIDADVVARAAKRLVSTASFAIMEAKEFRDPDGLLRASGEVSGRYWASMQAAARHLSRALQEFKSKGLDSEIFDSTFAGPVSMAASVGYEIAQAIEQLADHLHEEMGPAGRAEANPVVYVAGYGLDGKPLAIAADAEAIMDRADKFSDSPLSRKGAGLELKEYMSFNQALSTIGFASMPLPRILSEAEAAELVQTEQGVEPGETALRDALEKLLSERQAICLPNNKKSEIS